MVFKASNSHPFLQDVNQNDLDQETLTKSNQIPLAGDDCSIEPSPRALASNLSERTIDELKRIINQQDFNITTLTNDEIIRLIDSFQISIHRLEKILGRNNAERCVEIRRQYYTRQLERLDEQQSTHQQESRAAILKQNLHANFNFEPVVNASCENVIGIVSVPVGLAGPLRLDGREFHVPMATTEGCLVASTNRGLSALAQSESGVGSKIHKNAMTRSPIVKFEDKELGNAMDKVEAAVKWLNDPINKEKIKSAFRSTSKHTSLSDYTITPLGRSLHIRFEAWTGDAMGMNMVSKGAELALKEMQKVFPTMKILTLSGNMCADKKPSAINWIRGRGKSVVSYATIPAEVVEKVLKVSVDSLMEVYSEKVLKGSSLAGSIGGFNCHASNIVSAIFLATGQDVAQVVSSSNCILSLEKDSRGSLEVVCKMPSIECGTIGGGTMLPQQRGYLQMLGIQGSTKEHERDPDTVDSGSNACWLARVVCSTVMAGELSLLASLTEGTLVRSHMTHNRSSQSCNVV